MAYFLVGQRFGHLYVIACLKEKNGQGKTQYRCICDCGNDDIVITFQLTSKTKGKKTCGKCRCHLRFKSAYISWQAATSRCNNIKDKDYPNYGGRGIKLCVRWSDFLNFYLDMGEPATDMFGNRLTLERIDNNGNYCKNNCIWADRFEQHRNKRNYKLTTGDKLI